MPQLAVAAWTAFSSAAAAASVTIAASLTAAGVSAGIASTIATVAGYAQVASQVIGGVQSVASALGVGQKQPSLRGAWEQGRLTVDASARRKLLVGRTAVSGSLRANFQVGKYKDWFWQTVALGGAGPIESLDGVVIDRVTYTINGNGQCSYAPNDMQVFFRNGAWAQSAITSFPLRNASETPQGQWTSSHRGAGIAHVLWVARENPKVFTKGKPQPLFLVKGQTDLIDPRTGTTAGSAHRDNPAVWEYSWRLGFKSPVGYGSVDLGGFQKSVDQLDTATYAAWANRCESLGWKVSGEIDLNEDREAVSRAFCQAGAAVPIQKGGKDSVFYQSVKTSIMTLTEADFVGDIEVQTSPEIRDRANGIVPRFRSEAHGWETVAGSLVTATSYVTEDGGSRIAEINFPLVVSSTQAGQLAAYQMVQSRERILLRGPIHPRILAVGPGEAVTIDAPARGFSGVKMIMEGRQIGTDGAITCSFRSETDSKHSYATGVTITVPDTSLPGLSDGTIDSPTSGVWTAAVAQITSGDTSLPIIRVTGAVESFRVAAVLIRYRVTTGPGPWNNLAPANRDATRIEIDTVTPNTSYDLEVSYISVTGKESAWTSLGTVSTGTFVAGEAGAGPGGAPILNSLVPSDGNLFRYSLMERGTRGYQSFATGGASIVNPTYLLAFSGIRLVKTDFTSSTNGSTTYLGTNAQGLARVKPSQRYSIQARTETSGPIQSSVLAIDWRNDDNSASLGFSFSDTVTGTSPLGTLRQFFATAPAGAAFANVFLISTNTNGGAGFLALYEGQITAVTASTTVHPAFTQGPFGDDGADITGSNTAAAIVNQGTGATANNLTGLNPTEGGKLGGIEVGADVTAGAVPVLEGPASVSFDVDAAGALDPSSQVPRTLQFIRKRGATDVSTSTTWSIVSPVNITLGAITNGGVNITAVATGVSVFTVRSVRDGVTLDLVVSIAKNTITVGGGGGGKIAIDNSANGIASGTYSEVLSVSLASAPTGVAEISSSYEPTGASGTSTDFQLRLTRAGVMLAEGSSFQGIDSTGLVTPDWASEIAQFAGFYSAASGTATWAIEARRTSGSGSITTATGQLVVNQQPT